MRLFPMTAAHYPSLRAFPAEVTRREDPPPPRHDPQRAKDFPMKSIKTLLFAGLALSAAFGIHAEEPGKTAASAAAIEGTWALDFADVQHPDGTRTHDFGEAPKGLMQVDRQGHYSIFIFDSGRPKFAAKEKGQGTPEEIRAALMGSSSHYGTVEMDPAKGTLTFHIEGSTYPNWEGTTQVRSYMLSGDKLSYKVPPRPNGDIPLTGWKRMPR